MWRACVVTEAQHVQRLQGRSPLRVRQKQQQPKSQRETEGSGAPWAVQGQDLVCSVWDSCFLGRAKGNHWGASNRVGGRWVVVTCSD